jgi:hypothetical protein
VRKLLASLRRKFPLAVRVTHADIVRHLARNARRCGGRFFLGWDAISCQGALHPRHIWDTSDSAFSRAMREAPLVASTCCVFNVAWEFLVFSYVLHARYVHNVVLHFAVY